MDWPAGLVNSTRSSAGTWDAPGDTTLTWDVTDAWAYALIPINHHAPGPAFTECHIDGASGSHVVPAAMMDPLAVITGLEFQTFDHVRFAAATLPQGCVEFRLRVYGYPQAIYP